MNGWVFLAWVGGFYGEFTHTYQDNYFKDFAKGVVYYSSEVIVFDVFKPLRQRMKLLKDKMIIYYPKEKTAFVIKYRVPYRFPFSVRFNVKNIEDELKSKGFILKKSIKKEILQRKWKNPKYGIEITLGIKKDKLYYIQTVTPGTGSKIKTFYENYSPIGTLEIPTTIYTQGTQNQNKFQEKIVFTNLKPLESSCDSIFKFSIPKGTKIKEITWP